MPTVNSVTTADDFLKTLYPQKRIKFLGYQNNPFLALIKKDENFVGRNKAVVCHYAGAAGGRSRTFSTAQANASPERGADFLITRVKDYAVNYIETEAIQAAESDLGSFLNLAKGAVESSLRAATNNLAMAMYRNHGGARGRIATGGIASTTFTLANPEDIVHFEKDMAIVQSTADGTSGSLGSGDTTVSTVNRRAGTLTVASATNFSALDYLFQKGDFGGALHGLASWVPAVAPSPAENFFGTDRSADSRLYGLYLDGSSMTIQEAIERADQLVFREGGMADTLMMHPKDVNAWRVSLADNVRYERTSVSSGDVAGVSFGAIQLASLNGKGIKIIPDRNCPQGTAYLLQLDTWELSSLGSAPKILEGMGNKFIWAATSDAVEIRCGAYAEMSCWAPAWNCQILLPS